MCRIAVLACAGLFAMGWSLPAAGEQEIKGWTPIRGDWKRQGSSIACNAEVAGLEYEKAPKELIEIEFLLTIRSWAPGDLPRVVGIVWGAETQDQPEYHAVITPDKLIVAPRPETPGLPEKSIAFAPPLGKPIPVRARITKNQVLFLVGSAKLEVPLTSEPMGKLRLAVARADVTFSKLKVKVK